MTNRLGVRFLDPADATTGQVPVVQSDGTVAWADLAGGGGGAGVLDDLADVDTTTTPPTQGQGLYYDATGGVFLPGDPPAGGGGGGGGWTLLGEHVFATPGAGHTFTVPSGYDDLRVVVVGRTDEPSTRGILELVLNGDTTASNYSYRRELDIAGSGAANYMGLISAANSGSPSLASVCDWTFPGYGGTAWHKAATGRWTAGTSVGVGSLSWANTAAVTSLRVQARAATASNFLAGTTIRLYAL